MAVGRFSPGDTAPRRLTAVIACYRDAEAVPHMYRRLREVFEKLKVEGEIIFVNDASPDNVREVLTQLAAADSMLTVVNHTRNFGSQNAFTSGMRISTGDAVILLDGDLQDPPELISDFYARWMEGYDVVYGVRIQRDAPPHMRFLYKAFYRLFSASSYVKVPVDAGDFSLLDRRVVDAVNALPENNRFIRGLRAWVGFRQVGVPYVRPERMFGHTTNSFLGNLAWARKAMFSFSYVPLEMITGLAFVAVALSMGAAVLQLIVKLVVPNSAPSGFATVIILVLFVGGLQLLSLSIIGGYLAHIYDEVKRRPPYIVDDIVNHPTRRSSHIN